METVYVGPDFPAFFVKGINPVEPIPLAEAIHKSLRQNTIQLEVPLRFADRLTTLGNSLSESDKAMLKILINMQASGRIRLVSQPVNPEMKLTIPKSILEDLRCVLQSSLIIEQRVTEEAIARKLTAILRKQFLNIKTDQQAEAEPFFTNYPLPSIVQDQPFSWRSYLKPVSHFTSDLVLLDRFILKDQAATNNIKSILSIFNGAGSTNIHLKIITESASMNIPGFCQEMRSLTGSTEIYQKRPVSSKTFHDRWLVTDQIAINSPAGFDMESARGKARHDTIPVVYGRYSADGNHWQDMKSAISKLIEKDCQRVYPV